MESRRNGRQLSSRHDDDDDDGGASSTFPNLLASGQGARCMPPPRELHPALPLALIFGLWASICPQLHFLATPIML